MNAFQQTFISNLKDRLANQILEDVTQQQTGLNALLQFEDSDDDEELRESNLPDLVQDRQSCNYQFCTIDKLFGSLGKLPQPAEGSHSNALSDFVVAANEGIFNLSVHRMQAHQTTPLKLAVHTFKTPLRVDLEANQKTTTSAALSLISQHSIMTLQTPALVDALCNTFFPGAMERKRHVRKLVSKFEPGVFNHVEDNGGYILRYIACNKLNPKHTDKHNDLKIPSTLVYGGDFTGGATFLTLTESGIHIPVKLCTLLGAISWVLTAYT
ncbi:hypothetical protein HDU77_011524 [Chytriomyces hyalinus]|nr:hypothetical protein HDU77_011524 [Chytriomyces hyalinus]